MALVGLLQLLGEDPDLTLALDHHPREARRLPFGARRLVGGAAPALQRVRGLLLKVRDPLFPIPDRRVHLAATVTEKGPLEAVQDMTSRFTRCAKKQIATLARSALIWAAKVGPSSDGIPCRPRTVERVFESRF